MNRVFPALRGVAILLVILNHTIHMGTQYPRSAGLIATNGEQAILYILSGLGLFAVPIFLFLSGSFFSYAARQDDLRANYKVVWVNLRNVLFPYLIWSFIFYLEIYLVHQEACTPSECLKQLVVGYPYNFIPLLLFFYLISPLLILAIRRWNWIPVVLIGLFQLMLLNILQPGILGFRFPDLVSRFVPPVLSRPLSDWAIYFPLGLIYGKFASSYLPVVHKNRWWLAGLVVVTYLLALFDIMALIRFPLAKHLFPFFFMLVAPTINRSRIPAVKSIESIGKRAYGLYFMNLIVLDLMVVALTRYFPAVLNVYPLVLVFLFLGALFIPLAVMLGVERIKTPPVYRYVFG